MHPQSQISPVNFINSFLNKREGVVNGGNYFVILSSQKSVFFKKAIYCFLDQHVASKAQTL